MFAPIELIPIVMFITIGYVIKVLSDNVTKRKLIEKGVVDENIKYLYDQPGSRITATLKWGMVMIGIGLAIIIAYLFGYDIEDEITFALLFIFAGLGLLFFYIIANKKSDTTKNEETDR